jgi:hypothetical protein
MTEPIDLDQARRILSELRSDLQQITSSDPEQEVRGIAVAAVDAALSAVRGLVADSPVLRRIDDVISPESIEAGEPIRAIDVLVVVGIMHAVLPPAPNPYGRGTWEDDFMTRPM